MAEKFNKFEKKISWTSFLLSLCLLLGSLGCGDEEDQTNFIPVNTPPATTERDYSAVDYFSSGGLEGNPANQTSQTLTFYVDQDHTQANDQNPGTEALPLSTIQAAVDRVQAGDTVVVIQGTYTESVHFDLSGTAGQEISIIPYQNDLVILDGENTLEFGFVLNDNLHIIIQGLAFQNYTQSDIDP